MNSYGAVIFCVSPETSEASFSGPHMHIVYILESKIDKSWYIGQTDDLKRRLIQHNSGNGGRTTRIKGASWKLIYAEAYLEKQDALGRERFLKGGSGRKYLSKQLTNYLGMSRHSQPT